MSDAFAAYAYLGLNRNPFPPTPDAMAYFYTHWMEAECAELRHCLDTRKGIALVTGEVGLGKSTLLRRLLDDYAGAATTCALVFNTYLQGQELLAAICADFNLPADGDMSTNLGRLNEFVIAEQKVGNNCVLLIDDAQNLTADSLELVRLLTNLETGQEKLLQIILCGQPELDQMLRAPALRQLRSRIAKHVYLLPLSCDEIAKYFAFRANAVGSSGRLRLGRGAARTLYKVSGGNLRCLHRVLDRCLYGLIIQRATTIDSGLIKEAAAETDGRQPPRAVPHRRRVAIAMACLAMAAVGIALMPDRHLPDTAVRWMDTVFEGAVAKARTIIDRPVTPARQATAPSEVAALPAAGSEPVDETACFGRLEDRYGAGNVSLHSLADFDAGSKVASLASSLCRVQVEDQHWIAVPSINQPVSAINVRRIQRQLAQFGFLPTGSIDGLMGPITEEALQAFQRDLGLSGGDVPGLSVLHAMRVLDVTARPSTVREN